MSARLTAKQRDVEIRPGCAVRYSIPEAFVDGGGLVIECRAYEMTPGGGRGRAVQLSPAYWQGILPKLAEKRIA